MERKDCGAGVPEEHKPEYPPGFIEASKKYPTDYEEGSVEDIWGLIEEWRDFENGSPQIKIKFNAVDDGGELSDAGFQDLRNDQNDYVAEFKAKVLKAILADDKVFLANLFKAVFAPTRPRSTPEMNSIIAAMKAFWHLFVGPGLVSRDDWPTKQEVRKLAEGILKLHGLPLPTERHWPRIFKNAGLSELLSVTRGRAHKLKPNFGTK